MTFWIPLYIWLIFNVLVEFLPPKGRMREKMKEEQMEGMDACHLNPLWSHLSQWGRGFATMVVWFVTMAALLSVVPLPSEAEVRVHISLIFRGQGPCCHPGFCKLLQLHVNGCLPLGSELGDWQSWGMANWHHAKNWNWLKWNQF